MNIWFFWSFFWTTYYRRHGLHAYKSHTTSSNRQITTTTPLNHVNLSGFYSVEGYILPVKKISCTKFEQLLSPTVVITKVRESNTLETGLQLVTNWSRVSHFFPAHHNHRMRRKQYRASWYGCCCRWVIMIDSIRSWWLRLSRWTWQSESSWTILERKRTREAHLPVCKAILLPPWVCDPKMQ